MNGRLRLQAEAKQSVFIATTNTDFSDKAMQRLAATCPGGEVMGIQARHSTHHGFFVYENRLRLTGHCVTATPPEPGGHTLNGFAE